MAVGEGDSVGSETSVAVGMGWDDAGLWLAQALSIRTKKMDRINLQIIFGPVFAEARVLISLLLYDVSWRS
jgi:hypothetical protein